MSKLKDFFTELGYEVSKDNIHRGMQRVRVEVPVPTEELLTHLIGIAKEKGFDVNEEETLVNLKSSQIFFWLKPVPVTPKTPEELLADERASAIEDSLGEPEPEIVPNSTIGIDLDSTVSTDTSYIDPDIEPEVEIPIPKESKPEEEVPEEVKEIAKEL